MKIILAVLVCIAFSLILAEETCSFHQENGESACEQTNTSTKDASEDEKYGKFRQYRKTIRETVEEHYRMMRQFQTVEYVQRMREKWLTFDKAEMTVWEAFEALKDYVDSSDPDTTLPNLEHMLQTAEGARKDGQPDWMQLVGLLHDLGKIMFLWGTPQDGQSGTADGPQWGLGGDIFPVGCRLVDELVYPEFNQLNPDMQNPNYNTQHGMYAPNIGLDNVLFSFGHDEYLYQMLRFNNATLPEEALRMVRFHSFYAWHSHGAYEYLMAPEDYEYKRWTLEFNKYDLYTKADERPNLDQLKPYYQSLIEKYLPEKLHW